MRSRSRTKSLIAFALLVGTSAAALACNAILGLNDFNAVDGTDSGANPDVINNPDQLAPDSGPDVIIIPIPDGAASVTWARWHMPEAVQPDGLKPSYPPDAQALGNGTIKDNVTGLVWREVAEDGTYSTFEAARDACGKQSAAGGGWRLPTRIELVSILDHTKQEPALPRSADGGSLFQGGPTSGKYWTSSVVKPLTNPIQFWGVDIKQGTVEPSVGTGAVRCVKGGT